MSWKKITKKQALEIMGTHAHEIVLGEKDMISSKFKDVSYCVPSTGKNIWAHRKGAVFTYQLEE